MSKLNYIVPQNLTRLWAEEDKMMVWASTIISSEGYLQEHLKLIEAYMDCIESVRRSAPPVDRHIALLSLFLRTFDASSYCIRSAMSGNYIGSAMYARDLLETQFLLDYLLDEPGRPEAWLSTPPGEITEEYKPFNIRICLDKRDGFKGEKRRQHYKYLSTLGIHPSPGGLELKRDGGREINSMPFKQKDTLEACIQEAAKVVLPLAEMLRNYCSAEIESGKSISSRLALILQRTHLTHFGNV